MLGTKESLAGQAEVFEQQDDDIGSVDNESSVDDALGTVSSDSSLISIENNGSRSISTVPSSPSDAEEATEGTDEELAVFDRKLAQALGTRTGHLEADGFASSSSDEAMDDEQMEQLDHTLESMFRERKKATSRKREQTDAKARIVDFKCRVLELLDIYVKNECNRPLTTNLLLPILLLIKTTTSPLVSRKGCDLIGVYARLCKGNRLPRIDRAEPIFDLLCAIHEAVGQQASNEHSVACTQASLLLTRILFSHNKENLRHIIQLYAKTQERTLFDPSCKVKAAFFTDWLNWCWSIKV